MNRGVCVAHVCVCVCTYLTVFLILFSLIGACARAMARVPAFGLYVNVMSLPSAEAEAEWSGVVVGVSVGWEFKRGAES